MMRLRFALLVLPCMLLIAGDEKAAGQKGSNPPPTSAAPAAGKSAVSAGLPASAAENGPNLGGNVDVQGKAGVYREVPSELKRRAAGQKAGDPPPASAAPVAADSSDPAGLPAGAIKIGPYRWRYTDAQGKVWVYRDTPFGLTKFPDQEPPAEVAPPNWKAVRVGDEIQFERPTPFGGMRWTKKEDQLDSLERKVWERDRPKNEPASQPAGATGPAKE